MINIDIQYATESKLLPHADKLRSWILQALANIEETNLTLRIVDIPEITQLNRNYRGKNKPTNVLSFPFENNNEHEPMLGDIVICAPVVETEAQEQQKSLEAHWAHLVIHGCLHLQGYDHNTEAEANVMEPLEVKLLKGLGFPNPYIEVTETKQQNRKTA